MSSCKNEQKTEIVKPPLDFYSYGLVHLFQVVVQANIVDELLQMLDKDEENHLRADYVLALKPGNLTWLRGYFARIFNKILKYTREEKLRFTKFECKMIVFFIKETKSKIIITPCGEIKTPSVSATNSYMNHMKSCNYCRLFYDMISTESNKNKDDLKSKACNKYLLNEHFVELVLDYTKIHVKCHYRYKTDKITIKEQLDSQSVKKKLSCIAVNFSKMYIIIVNDNNIDMGTKNEVDQSLSSENVIDKSNKFLGDIHQRGKQFLSKHDGFMKILIKYQFITLTCRQMYPKHHKTIHRSKSCPLTPEEIATVQKVFENEYQSANGIQGSRNATRIRFVSKNIDTEKVLYLYNTLMWFFSVCYLAPCNMIYIQ